MLLISPPVQDVRKLEVRDGKDRWVFVQRVEEGTQSVSKNGRYVYAPSQFGKEWLPDDSSYRFTRPRIKTAFPVVAARLWGASPKLRDTCFFAIIGGRLVKMGDAPESGSRGPVLWKGRLNYWLFDNTNDYDIQYLKESWECIHMLYRIDHHGRLRFVRKWKAPKGQLPDTVEKVSR